MAFFRVSFSQSNTCSWPNTHNIMHYKALLLKFSEVIFVLNFQYWLLPKISTSSIQSKCIIWRSRFGNWKSLRTVRITVSYRALPRKNECENWDRQIISINMFFDIYQMHFWIVQLPYSIFFQSFLRLSQLHLSNFRNDYFAEFLHSIFSYLEIFTSVNHDIIVMRFLSMCFHRIEFFLTSFSRYSRELHLYERQSRTKTHLCGSTAKHTKMYFDATLIRK